MTRDFQSLLYQLSYRGVSRTGFILPQIVWKVNHYFSFFSAFSVKKKAEKMATRSGSDRRPQRDRLAF